MIKPIFWISGKDNVMGSGKTDDKGNFAFAGTDSELTNVDGELRIYHKCDAGIISVRYKEWKYRVPDRYRVWIRKIIFILF